MKYLSIKTGNSPREEPMEVKNKMQEKKRVKENIKRFCCTQFVD